MGNTIEPGSDVGVETPQPKTKRPAANLPPFLSTLQNGSRQRAYSLTESIVSVSPFSLPITVTIKPALATILSWFAIL